ncbi:MAG TPA: hypothetical protein VGA56_07185 [Opitutaceae bacterium]
MNTSARNILSSLSGLALVAWVVISFVTAGFASTSAVLGISALVAWTLVQMVVVDLAPRAAATQPPPTAHVIEFPAVGAAQRQAA